MYRVWQIKASTFVIDLFWGGSLLHVLRWLIWEVHTSIFEIGVAIDCKWLQKELISILVKFPMTAIFHQFLPNYVPISMLSLFCITWIDNSPTSLIIFLCKMVLCINLRQILMFLHTFYKILAEVVGVLVEKLFSSIWIVLSRKF